MDNMPTENILKIFKEIQKAIDWLIKLPCAILSELNELDRLCADRKKRIEIQTTIVNLRELAKSIQLIYFFKGSVKEWAHSIVENEYSEEEFLFLREFINDIINGLRNVKTTICEVDIHNLELSTSAIIHIDNLIIYYEKYLSLPDVELYNNGEIINLLSDLEKFQDESCKFIFELDKIRRVLDATY